MKEGERFKLLIVLRSGEFDGSASGRGGGTGCTGGYPSTA
jgi:hypothetical protein